MIVTKCSSLPRNRRQGNPGLKSGAVVLDAFSIHFVTNSLPLTEPTPD